MARGIVDRNISGADLPTDALSAREAIPFGNPLTSPEYAEKPARDRDSGERPFPCSVFIPCIF